MNAASILKLRLLAPAAVDTAQLIPTAGCEFGVFNLTDWGKITERSCYPIVGSNG